MATAKRHRSGTGCPARPEKHFSSPQISAFRRLSRNAYLHINLASVSDDSGVLALQVFAAGAASETQERGRPQACLSRI